MGERVDVGWAMRTAHEDWLAYQPTHRAGFSMLLAEFRLSGNLGFYINSLVQSKVEEIVCP